MKSIFLILSVFCLPIIHDVPVAYFKIQESKENVLLEINFDTEDLNKALKITSSSEVTLNLIQDYINNHTNFEFDSCITKVIVKNISLNQSHTTLLCSFKGTHSINNNISIKNTCLLSIKDHSNIVSIKHNSKLREYRMHKERTTITIDY